MSEMIKNAAEAPLGMEETSVASESVVVQTVSVPPVRKKHKISKGDRIFEGIVYTILAIWTLVTIYPLIYVLSCSISPPEDVYMGRVFLFPTSFDFSSYAKVLSADMIWRGYLNTIIYVVVGTLISCALTIPAGYVLSRKDFRPRGVLMTIFMITMFFSGGMIPTFLVVKSLGLMNKMLGFILPGALSVWNVIVVRTFMSSSIAWEIQEAAKADGASDFRTFFAIVLPLSMPIVAVMVLFYAVGYWNSYFNALLYLSDQSKWPLQMVLREVLIKSDSSMAGGGGGSLIEQAYMAEAIKYTTIVVSTLPILFIYPFLQRYFIKGVMIGSVKG